MNRSQVVVYLCLLLGWTAMGCQSLFGSDSARKGLSGSSPDGGSCMKDPQIIKNVMLSPPTCNATNPCPCGTYCSAQTGGNCVADCVDDTWCSPGFTCSAFGQCLNASAADAGGTSTTTDPACPTNSALLDSLSTSPRICQFDDQCPFGSYCNHLSDVCKSDCRKDSDCASQNTATETFVCDCLGQCAAVGTPAPKPTTVLPTLQVTPNQFTFALPDPITTPVWGGNGTRQVTVVVSAQFLTQSGSGAVGPNVTIQANPGPGLMVQCPGGADGGVGPTGSSCQFTIDPTSYTASNNVFKSAPVTLLLQPSSGAPTATNWTLRLESTDVSNAPQSVFLSYAGGSIDSPPPPNPVNISTPPAGYRGYGTVQIGTPLGGTLTVPVLAREYQNNLVLYDSSRILTPSGITTVKESANPGDWETFIDGNSNGETVLQGIGSGGILSRITAPPAITLDNSSGVIYGSFTRSVYTEHPFITQSPQTGEPTSPFEQVSTLSFSLQPALPSDGGYCSQDSDCPSGASCDTGFCTNPGPKYQAEGTLTTVTQAPNFVEPTNFIHTKMSLWGGYSGGFDIPRGYIGIYAPSSSVLPSFVGGGLDRTNGYTFKPALPAISGEPTASLLSASGTLVATSGPLAIPLLTQHDGPASLSAAQLLSACLTELARTPSQQVGEAITTPDGSNSQVYDFRASCINLGRVSVALYDQTTLERMLEGWLTVQSFVGREGLEEANLSSALGGTGIPSSPDGGAGDATSVPDLSQTVGVLEDGLSFIVAVATDPDAAFVGGHLRTSIWSDLDYRATNMTMPSCSRDADCNGGLATPLRCDTTVTPSVCRLPYLNETPQYQQRLGIPYFALQAAAAYSNLLAAYLQQVATQTFGQPADNSASSARQTALDHYGTGMRLMLFIEQWANAINVAGGIDTVNGTCPGNKSDCTAIAQQFNAAARELAAVQSRLATAAQALQNSTNPFNIPEDDVPLFFGDPSGTNSQYFAASDYLLTGWAVPAVTQAQAYLDAARAAWITESQDAVQDELNQHNRQQEVDQLMSKYGAPVLANCGNLQVPDGQGGLKLLDDTQVIPYFADGTKTLSNDACYIDQTCGGGPQTLDQNAELRSLVNETFVDSNGNIVAGTGGQTAVQQFLASEMCKIADIAQYRPADTFIKAMMGVCPGGGGGCSIQRFGSDQSLYIVNGATHVPVAALFVPVARKDIGTGNFYSAATDGPGTDPANIYGYEDLRTDTDQITIKYGSKGTPDTYKCVPLVNGKPPAGTHIVFPPSPPGSGKPSSPVACSGSTGTPATPAVYSQVAIEFGLTATSTCVAKIGADYPRPSGNVLPASCHKGAMGVAFHQMQSDILKIQDAKQILSNGTANTNATEALCEMEDMGIQDIMNLQAAYNQMVSDYQELQAAAGFWEGLVSFAGGIAASVASPGSIGTVFSGFDQIVNTAVGISSDAVQNEATSLQQMQENFGNSVEAQQCWNTFLAQRGELATAMTNIQIAVNDLGTQQEVLANLAAENVLSINEGIAVLQQENASPVSSLGHQFWVDEKVEQFRKQFQWSRRLLYLAMRAVEYEFQESLPYRSQIVSASTPAQLQDVVIGLQGEEASRTINRRRPSEASVVLSLRDDVLALPDNSKAPSGERNWTPAQRFQSRVSDPRYAYRDSKGNYLGQAIPFSLAPTGVLESRCGERLWTATATIQGDGIEASAPGASVLLLKRNTFASQYCSGKSPTTDTSGNPIPAQQMQVGVIHESADLFQPGSAVDLSDANEFTAALLYPWFNIPKTQFYATSYQNGSSQELAGRGLYGDYVLLFPQEVLDAGFALGNVEDVLLRFDYLSVDNLSQ